MLGNVYSEFESQGENYLIHHYVHTKQACLYYQNLNVTCYKLYKTTTLSWRRKRNNSFKTYKKWPGEEPVIF